MSPGRKGKWTEKILKAFGGSRKDGYAPWAGVVLDAAGNIYGTTAYGPASAGGSVFELVAPAGKGPYKEEHLWDFPFGWQWGLVPVASLTLDSAGNLYGTTEYGGASVCNNREGCGVVFEVFH